MGLLDAIVAVLDVAGKIGGNSSKNFSSNRSDDRPWGADVFENGKWIPHEFAKEYKKQRGNPVERDGRSW